MKRPAPSKGRIMAEPDRIIDEEITEVPEIPEVLQHVLLAALNDAKEKLEDNKEVVPFTALAVKKNLFIETHPGESTEECFSFARQTVQSAAGADGYALCYDGYIDTDDGEMDALIAEGGVPGEDQGYAIAYLYEMPEDEGSDEAPHVTSEPFYLGPAPNFMMFTSTEPFRGDDEEEDVADDGLLDDAPDDIEVDQEETSVAADDVQ